MTLPFETLLTTLSYALQTPMYLSRSHNCNCLSILFALQVSSESQKAITSPSENLIPTLRAFPAPLLIFNSIIFNLGSLNDLTISTELSVL